MKRSFVVVLTLSLLVCAVSACVKNTPPTTKNAPLVDSAPASTTPAPSATAAVSPPVASSTSDGSEPPVQLSETGVTETVDAQTASAQPLALKITQIAAPASSSQWKEGVNYTTLIPAQPTNALPGQVEVNEVFWYGCPHCYALDSFLESWRAQGKASYVNFVRVPVMWGAIHRTHARLFYTAEQLGKLDELHSQIFREIHENTSPLSSPEQIAAFFTAHGVSQADFQKAFASSAVDASLTRAETLGLRYHVESVPLIIVNGKYVTDVGKAGGQQQLIALINDLAAREKRN